MNSIGVWFLDAFRRWGHRRPRGRFVPVADRPLDAFLVPRCREERPFSSLALIFRGDLPVPFRPRDELHEDVVGLDVRLLETDGHPLRPHQLLLRAPVLLLIVRLLVEHPPRFRVTFTEPSAVRHLPPRADRVKARFVARVRVRLGGIRQINLAAKIRGVIRVGDASRTIALACLFGRALFPVVVPVAHVVPRRGPWAVVEGIVPRVSSSRRIHPRGLSPCGLSSLVPAVAVVVPFASVAGRASIARVVLVAVAASAVSSPAAAFVPAAR